MKRIIFSVLGISAALVFTGCASYNAAPLNSLSSEIIESAPATEKTDIIVAAKAFDKIDCKRYLDRDVISKGYQPVQLYILNNSDKTYSFTLNRLNLSCARPEEVANKVHTSTVGRAVGYGAGAIILWPLVIPAIVDGLKSADANERLDLDFIAKTARDEVLYPHSHLNKLIFVPVNEYRSHFSLALKEQETHQIRMIDVVTN